MIPLEGHREGAAISGLCFTSDGRRLVSASQDGTLRLWDLAAGTSRVVAAERYPILSLALSSDDVWLAWVTPHQANVRRLKLRRPIWLHKWTAEHAGVIGFSLDGDTVCYGSDTALGTWRPPQQWASAWDERIPGVGTTALAYSPDERFLATAHAVLSSSGKTSRYDVRLRNADDGDLRKVLPEPTTAVCALSFSPNGKLLAATFGSHWIVWAVPAGDVVLAHKDKSHEFLTCAFSSDGQRLYLTLNDNSIRVRETQTWGEVNHFDWRIGQVMSLAIASDGMKAAAGGSEGKIAVWDVEA